MPDDQCILDELASVHLYGFVCPVVSHHLFLQFLCLFLLHIWVQPHAPLP